MKVKIMWFSQHSPVPRQIFELKRLFGEVEIIQDPKPFSGADDVINRFKKSGAEEMVIVAPISVIAQIVQRGVNPLYAEMTLVGENEECDVEYRGRRYRFDRFTRIKRVVIEKEEVVPRDQDRRE